MTVCTQARQQPPKNLGFKIGIVGADESKWRQNQIPTVKEIIDHILHGVDFKIPIKSSSIHMCYKGNSRIASYWIYGRQNELTLVSGGCPKKGVDVLAEDRARELGLQTEIHLPEVHSWSDVKCCFGCRVHHLPELSLEKIIGKCSCPCHTDKTWQPQLKRLALKGYRSRNIDIAKAIPPPSHGVLYDIEPEGSCRHCGGTGQYGLRTAKLKKTTKPFALTCRWCKGTGVYGGGIFTLREARKLSKEVYQVVIS